MSNLKNEEFIKELELRSKNFLNGTSKAYSWEETKQAAIEKVNLKNN